MKRVFYCTSDVKAFFSYLDDVANCNKSAEDKIYALISHLDREVLLFCFDKFTHDCEMVEDAKDYEKVKASFLEKYQRKEGISTIMKEALNSRLDIYNMEFSLNKIRELYDKANFNKEAKFAILQKAVSKY